MPKFRPSIEPADAADRLREMFPPGSTARTISRHVSKSGMTHRISVVNVADGDTFDATYLVAALLGEKLDTHHEGISRGGSGMDMGFDLVYSMSRRLYPDGYPCIGEGCPANDHSNGDRDYTPGHAIHRDGGYAVSQRWL